MSFEAHKVKKWLILFAKGSAMGVADLIPGISGGTLALVMGIHPELMQSLKTLKLGHFFSPRKMAYFFLSAVFLGIFFSLALGAKGLSQLLNHPTGLLILYATFFGLIVGSFFFCLPKIGKWNLQKIFLCFLGMMMALGFVWMSFSSSKVSKLNPPLESTSLNHPSLLQASSSLTTPSAQGFKLDFRLIVCAILSICAMLLPGISGSQVMVLFGYYDSIIHAIALYVPLFLKGQIFNGSFWLLAQFALGMLLGLFFFSRLASYLYTQFPSIFMSFLMGVMVGSMPSVWPFWKTKITTIGLVTKLEKISPCLPSLLDKQTWLAFFCMAFGALFLLTLHFLEKKKKSFSS